MKYTLLYIIMVVACLSLTACRQRAFYYHYEHTPLGGWDRTDTLHFMVPAVSESSLYDIQLGLCTDSYYPYRNISIIAAHRVLPDGQSVRDTITHDVIDESGHPTGTGTSLFQYLFPLTTLQLKEGESLEVSVFHNMRREILPGVSSVGVQVKK